MSGSWPEGDQRKLPDESMAIVVGPTILPAQESAENPANEWCHEPVSEFVVTYNVDCFLFTQKAVRCLKVPSADDYLFVRGRLDIAKPVGTPAKTTHHHCFRTFFSVVHHFQDRLMAYAGTPARVCQQQETFSEQRAQAQTVEIDRRPKQMPQHVFLWIALMLTQVLLFDSQLSEV